LNSHKLHHKALGSDHDEALSHREALKQKEVQSVDDSDRQEDNEMALAEELRLHFSIDWPILFFKGRIREPHSIEHTDIDDEQVEADQNNESGNGKDEVEQRERVFGWEDIVSYEVHSCEQGKWKETLLQEYDDHTIPKDLCLFEDIIR